MKYIIAHLIRGEAKDKHEAITKDLVKKFDTFPIHDRIAPHLTLKRVFELDADGIKNLCSTLDTFVDCHTQSTYRLDGFNHFVEDVIYIDVKPSPEMLSTAKDLMNVLHKVENITFDEFDAIENDFHASVVFRKLKPFDYKEVWNYLNKEEKIDFDMKFDNIAIMKKEVDKWYIDRVWELPYKS